MASQFGFPTWTLWGMGLSAFGALVAIVLAFLAQSPRLLSRLNLNGQRLDLRARSFTGYGLALLLLSLGFFLAGVPINAGESQTVVEATDLPGLEEVVATESAEVEAGETEEATSGQSGAMVGLPTSSAGGESGAMGGLITPQATLDSGEVITGTLEASTAEVIAPPGEATGEATAGTPAATPTRAPTVTPTSTPSPTLTPTPILVPTARINDETSTLPVRRLPGGPVLVVLVRGDTVIPMAGNAFYSGQVWQEIQTVDGVIGWVQDRFLDYGE
jgi:hypothetical protein